MIKLKRKVFAIATFLTMLGMAAGPGIAQGATIEELLASIAALETELLALQAQVDGGTGATVSGCTITSFDRALKLTMTGDDVKCLQIVLNTDSATQLGSSGVGSAGNETSYFGPLTKAAVIKFQELYADEVLASWGLTAGTGFVGSTTRTKLNSILSAGTTVDDDDDDEDTDAEEDEEDTTSTFEAGLRVALSDATPIGRSVAIGAYDKIFAKIKFTAGTSEAYTVNTIVIHRDGLSDTDDISEVKLYDNGTPLGTTQAFSVTTYKATFSGLNWEIPAGTTKVLTVKASIDTSTNNATQGNSPSMGIASASDVVVADGTSVTGNFPVYGNEMMIAGTSVGQLDVDQNDNSVASDVISGSTDQEVGSFKFTADSTEGFDIEEITLTEIGTSVGNDISNITLKYLGETVATVGSLTNGQATFTGSPLFSLNAGIAKNIDIYVDIASDVISERTVRFEVTESSDVTAVGDNTGGVVKITYSSGSTFINRQSSTWTIRQGTLTVAYDGATNLSSQVYTIGASQVILASFKFSAGSREGLKITKLKFNATGTDETYTVRVADNEFQSVQLYIDGSETSSGHVGGISSGIITFLDTGGLFEVPKSGNTVVTVKADITTAADTDDGLGFYISAVTNIKMKGLESAADIFSDSSHITLSGIGTNDAVVHGVREKGTLTVANEPTTPAAKSIHLGDDDLTIFKFKLSAEFEDIAVSSIKVRFFNNNGSAGPAVGAAISATVNDQETTSTDYITSIQLWDSTALIKEVSAPTAGYVNFNTGNLEIPKNGSKVFSVIVDIPAGSNLQYLAAHVGDDTGDSTTAADDIVSTGKQSAKDISTSETGYAKSNTFTLASPALAVLAASAPPAQSIVTNTGEAWLGRLQLSATYEDVKVSRVIITFDDTSALNAISSAEDIFSEVKICLDNDCTNNQIGATRAITNSNTGRDRVTFSGITNLTVNKDQTVSLDIYAMAIASSTDTVALTWNVGHASNTDIIGVGVYSNATVNSTGGKQASKNTTVIAQGALTVSVDANTPVAANHAVGVYGATGVEFAKLLFEATYEAIKIKTLVFTLSDPDMLTADDSIASSSDINKLYLYEAGNSTPVGQDPQVTDVGTYTYKFSNENGMFTVPANGSKVITLVGDVFGIGTGANSGDAPVFYISALQDSTSVLIPEGVASNASSTIADGTPNPETTPGSGASNSANTNAQYLYKTVISVSKNASSPSGSAVAGSESEVLRFDVEADSAADAVFNSLAIKMSGSANLTSGATGNAYLCKASETNCSSNYLAIETYKAFTLANPVDDGNHGTAGVTTTIANAEGIPMGATIHAYDESAAVWDTVVLNDVKNYIDSAAGETGATLTWESALGFTATGSDIFYYQPMQPGNGSDSSGKTHFGAMTFLAADTDWNEASTTVVSTDGFALGDNVTVKGFDVDGTATSTSVTLTIASTTATVLWFDSAMEVSIDYNENTVDTADADSVGRGYVYISAATSSILTAIAKGTTETYVVKGDTTGAASTKTIRAEVTGVADLLWDDKVQPFIDARTTGLPFVGGTLTY